MFWARIKNKVVIYTNAEIAKKVMAIRKRFDLAERTEIIVIDDVYKCDAEIYNKIKFAMKNEISQKFHRYPERPEANNPEYNYVVLLKPYFISDAVKKGLAKGMIAWLDFGYNHGGETYIYPEEFDYLWEYDFENKIHLFSMEKMDEMPIFQIVKTMDVYCMSGLIVAPDYLWNEFWQLCRNALLHLTACGLADDDQTIMLMAYREKTEIFEIHYVEDWLVPLKLFGGNHLTVKPKKKKGPISIWWRQVKKKLKNNN